MTSHDTWTVSQGLAGPLRTSRSWSQAWYEAFETGTAGRPSPEEREDLSCIVHATASTRTAATRSLASINCVSVFGGTSARAGVRRANHPIATVRNGPNDRRRWNGQSMAASKGLTGRKEFGTGSYP